MDDTSVLYSSEPDSSEPALIVICGPTASGKSGLAIALARRLGSIIISADSRQVYREFDIGTAKPSPADLQQAPHYLINTCEPTETLTVAEYQQQVQHLIAKAHRLAEPPPLLVGGTGLYIKSIVRGMQIPRVPPQAALRSQLAELGQPWCYTVLQQVDPAAAARIHPRDQVRTLRSLEVFYTTGIPMSQQQGERPPAYPILQIGLDCLGTNDQGDRLTQRIQARTQHMIAMGFVDEVQTLCHKYGEALPLLNTLGYQEVRHYLQGTLSLEDAIAQTVLHTRQFAKRQRTWFRADSTIEWFDSEDPNLVELVWQRVQDFLPQSS
ncbi:tRNA (adenosine(37)-N6)-dimethylallyltransferase MiaA [Leptolyngbya sp. AN02str]|uniref:tRNA (adenosine(37)-N6)-dimethylallyltransferase MiaA n=1 Tax=Leptolyngbya sp. AN02str TaxID=3423363 RepID=UPI003D31DD0D